jgi:hypothetical protein
MVRYKLLLLPMLCFLVLAQSCVHGDLDDCPPMVKYAVAFEYTNHTGKTDRFYEDVKKINLYVFDEDNLIYTTTTEISPYEKNFNIPLDLPMGNYHIIAWGNVLDDEPFAITPNEFEKGKTTFDEARLILERKAGNLSEDELEKLFYGTKDVEIALYYNRIDTVSLMNNTNRVRVVLYWDHGITSPENQIGYEDITVRLNGSNAVYKFSNDLELNKVIYSPYSIDLTGGILETDKLPNALTIFYYPDIEPDNTGVDSVVYDFSILRMLVNNEIKLTVLKDADSGIENLLIPKTDPNRTNSDYGVDIIGTSAGTAGFTKLMKESLHITTTQGMQQAFDQYENYRVNVYFKYDDATGVYITGEIKVTDWQLVEQDSQPGQN